MVFSKADAADGRIDDIFDPSKVPGSSVYMASNGTDLGMQAIFAGSFFLLFILLFSALRLRWPFIFSPRTRLTITSPPYLSHKFFGWFLATMRTPETYVLNTLGLDTVIFLRFYKMCMRLLLDIAFFSIVIIWPINIYWSKVNLDAVAEAPETGDNDGLAIPVSYSVTDYLFNLTLNISDPKQQWYLVPHIVFVYIFSGLAYYHISKFSSRWASLRWHFLMQSRHALVSRTVMLTGVPRHLAKSPRELEWFWSAGLQLGKIERVRVCPFNTRLTSSAKERAKYLVNLEHAYKQLLGNPCEHEEYDPELLGRLAVDVSDSARKEEIRLLEKWAKPSRRRKAKARGSQNAHVEQADRASLIEGESCSTGSEKPVDGDLNEVNHAASDLSSIRRPTAWVKAGPGLLQPWHRVDAINHWRAKYLTADRDFRQLRSSVLRGEDGFGRSTTAFVTFEDAATAHMVTQLSCYPNPGYMKARLAPEPRAVYWPNIWIPNHRKWVGFAAKWTCIFVIWAFWSVPVILFSSLLTPASLGKIFPVILSADHGLLRSFLSTTVPSVFLLLFLNMLPWILKQVHFITGGRTKPDIDYSVMTKMWAFLMVNVILVFGFSGTFWNLIISAVNRPGTIMQSLASNIPRVGTFFTGYILVLGVGYQPFKLLQLRPVIWHIGRQWLCSTPRDYARLVSPVYIDWYSVYPYPLLVFAIAMIYSTFSPPVVVGAVIYFAIGYPVMKYLLLYVYFHPFETAGMAWPKLCRRMILSIILYQVVMLAFVIVKGGGWYTFSLMPIIVLYMWFFYFLGWSLEKQGTVLPMYLWRNPPPNSSYPLPPDMDDSASNAHEFGYEAQMLKQRDLFTPANAEYGASVRPKNELGWHARDEKSHVLRGASSLNNICAQSTGRERARPPYLSHRSTKATRIHGLSKLSQPIAPQSPSPKMQPKVSVQTRRGPSHHRRESSRGVRTREMILANRGIRRTSPGSNVSWPRQPRNLTPSRTSATSATNSTPDQNTSATLSKSASRVRNQPSINSEEFRVSKRKRYKSLAEAATVEGSRLLVSLGRLPGEIYSRRVESKSRSKSGAVRSPKALGRDKLWFNGRNVFGLAGDRSTLSAGKRDSVVEDGNGGIGSPKQRVFDMHSDDEWEDMDCVPAEVSDRRQSKMAEDQQPCTTAEDWDPLVYLKPVGTSSYLHGTSSQPVHNDEKIGETLGTLLTGLDHPPLASSTAHDSTSSGLRRRTRKGAEPEPSQNSDPVDTSSSTSEANAASILGAEGSRHSERTEPRLRMRMHQTFQQVRDYFLAEFRPAAPILDLTYDQMYSQGIEDEHLRVNSNGEYVDNGDELPPLRQLIGRVLPRSVSRVFSPAPSAVPMGVGADTAPAIVGSATAPIESRRLVSPGVLDRTMLRASTAAEPRASSRVDRGSGTGKYVRRLVSTLTQSPLPRPLYISHAEGLSDQAAEMHNLEHTDVLEPLPPPLAPWLLAEPCGPSTQSSRSSHPPTDPEPSTSTASLPILSRTSNRHSSHKTSPAPRVPLASRMELNYVTRRSATPCMPTNIPAHTDDVDSEQLLSANYQKYAVERQSTFEADEFTDYLQTPMLNFRGILDRGIQDYVHPGLVGELPTLWLPVKQTRGLQHSEESSRVSGSVDLTRVAAYRRIIALLEQHRDDPMNCTDSVAAIVAAAAADNAFTVAGSSDQSSAIQTDEGAYSELHEVCVHSIHDTNKAEAKK
ncbi:hypothetical protein GGH12_000773 [Coemansia sp. RSA 1822]|nr:hypothetical protein LPJ76_001640 [Coemansia sp. RSA 638]KAJ2566619.1 hypothetical protein GGH12_000773 [Coemansia sp. RSA 1822]